MFVAKDSTEGVKSHNFFHEPAWSSLLLGLLVCLFVFSWSCTAGIQFFTRPIEGPFTPAIFVNFPPIKLF